MPRDSFADVAGNGWNLQRLTIYLLALITEFRIGTGLNNAIPAEPGGGVGIAAGQVGIPQIGNAAATGVGEGQLPAVDRGITVVGNPDAAGKAGTPVAALDIGAAGGAARAATGAATRRAA